MGKTVFIGLSVFLAAACQNRPMDYTLLVGEWAQQGQCDVRRNVYAPDHRYPWLKNGRYLWVENVNGHWETVYDGIYLTVPEKDLAAQGVRERGAIIITECPQTDGYLVHIQWLTPSAYRGYWDTNPDAPIVVTFKNPKDAFFRYVRCPQRAGGKR